MADMADKSSHLYIETPLLESYEMSKIAGCKVYLKMDNMQPTHTFKIRGIGNLIHKKREAGCSRVVSSSGGNAGLAAAYVARKLNMPCTIYVPSSTPAFMRDRLSGEGADVIVHGSVWDEANEKAVQVSQQAECAYIHPFDHPFIWDGHASLVTECYQQMHGTRPDVVICSVGGGGLMVGVQQGMQAVGWGDVPLLAMETVGADCFNQALEAGHLVTLPTISSVAKCLGALTVCEKAFHLPEKHPIISRVVTDKEAVDAMLKFLDDHKVLVEPACGAALAAVYSRVLNQLQHSAALPVTIGSVLIVVCGGCGISLEQLQQLKQQFHLE